MYRYQHAPRVRGWMQAPPRWAAAEEAGGCLVACVGRIERQSWCGVFLALRACVAALDEVQCGHASLASPDGAEGSMGQWHGGRSGGYFDHQHHPQHVCGPSLIEPTLGRPSQHSQAGRARQVQGAPSHPGPAHERPAGSGSGSDSDSLRERHPRGQGGGRCATICHSCHSCHRTLTTCPNLMPVISRLPQSTATLQ